ncbi:hypothetical protein [uncultured Mediterranean phage uvMED]|nr:hypothetical protein [uncultured Mediterranean phage uvMED]
MAHKIVNGQQVELTADEIAAIAAQETAWNDSAFDRAMADLRQRRNQLLAETDWTVLQDNPLTPAKRSEWMVYRTELRNITQGLNTVEDINNIDYPDKPNG